MGLQGRLEDEVWDKLAQLSAPPRTAPQKVKRVTAAPRQTEKPPPKPRQAGKPAPKRRQKSQGRKTGNRTPGVDSSRPPRATAAQTAEQAEFGRRLSELRGLLRAMQAGNPVNGVTPGVTSARLREGCALASWLRASGKLATRKQDVELSRMVLALNLLVKRHPNLLRPPSDEPTARIIPAAREWRPLDVSKIPIGPESSRWYTDPVNSK